MTRKPRKRKDDDEMQTVGEEPVAKPLVQFVDWAGYSSDEAKLVPDLARFFIENRKTAIGESAWNKLSEATQRHHISEAAQVAGGIVRQCFQVFAEHVFLGVAADVEQIAIKDGAKVVMLVDKHDRLIQQLIGRVGGRAYIALASAYQFGDASDHGVKAEPEQGNLHVDEPPLNDGKQEPAPPDHVEIEPPADEVQRQSEEGPGEEFPAEPPPPEIPPNKTGNRTISYGDDEL